MKQVMEFDWRRPALIWHLIVKDLRYQRGLLALVWLLALVMPIIAGFSSPGSGGANVLLTGPTCLFALICAVIILRVIQLDPPRRGIHFSATRPIGWFSLLASKLLFACAFLLIPSWVATLGAMYAVGMHFNFLDAVLFLTEGTICAAAVFSVVAAPAFFMRKLISAVMTIFGGVVVTGIALMLYIGLGLFDEPLKPGQPEPSLQLEHCRWLMFQLGLAFTGLAVALFCYRKRPWRESLFMLGSGVFVSVLLVYYWPFDLSVVFSDRMPELAPALRDKIKFHIEPPPVHPANIGSDGYVLVRGGLSGLQSPYYYVQTGENAELTLRSGRKLASSDLNDCWSQGLLLEAGRKGDSLQDEIMGFMPMPGQPRPWDGETLQAFHSIQGLYRDEDLRGVSIKGMATFFVGRATILGAFPVHDCRMVLNLPRRRYTMRHVNAGHGVIRLQIVKEYMALTLRGDLPDQEEWENLSWILINRRKGEYLTVTDDNRGSYLETLYLTRPDQAKGPIPADWINDAEIVCLSSESCGRISFPYEIPSIDLTH